MYVHSLWPLVMAVALQTGEINDIALDLHCISQEVVRLPTKLPGSQVYRVFFLKNCGIVSDDM